jgi:hypothetical protein
MDIPAWALSDRELWTPLLVMRAMVRAERVMRAVPMAIGPANDRAFWPDTADDEPSAEEEKFRPEKDDITRMEYVLVGFRDEDGGRHPAWLNGALLGYPEQRRILAKWVRWASRGKVDRDGVSQTEEEFARSLGLAHATLKRRKDFAAAIIATSLNEAALPVWHVEPPPRRNNVGAASSAGR